MALAPYTPTPIQLVTLMEADDAEPRNADTTNAQDEQLANGIAWLADRTRTDVFFTQNDDGDGPVTVYYTFDDTGAPAYQDGPFIDVTGCLEDDVLVARFQGLFRGNFVQVAAIRLDFILDFGGGNQSAQAHFAGALARFAPAASATDPFPGALQGYQVVDRDGTARIKLVGKTFTDDLELISAYTIIVDRYRY